MNDFLFLLNDFFSNLDLKSVLFGCLICYLCELFFVPVFRLKDGIFARIFQNYKKGV